MVVVLIDSTINKLRALWFGYRWSPALVCPVCRCVHPEHCKIWQWHSWWGVDRMGQGRGLSYPSLPLQGGPPVSTIGPPHLQNQMQKKENCYEMCSWLQQSKKNDSWKHSGYKFIISSPHTFQTGANEGGREVIVVVHQADVARGEADCEQWLLAVHWKETKNNTNILEGQRARRDNEVRCYV